MPTEPGINISEAQPRFVSGGELNAGIRDELAGEFAWPPSMIPVTRPLQDLTAVIDPGTLAEVAAAASNNSNLIFTLVSKEYIQTGLNWIRATQRLGIDDFLVICGDQFAYETLSGLGIHTVRAHINEGELDASFLSRVGFSAKGLAMTALKFPVARLLVGAGYNVIFSDADAVWLRDPRPYIDGSDIAFQRIDHHPAPVSRLWGFAACTGFVCFAHGAETVAFLDRCIEHHRSFHSDQVALNVALLQGEPSWHCGHAGWTPPGNANHYDRASRRIAFAKVMRSPIIGQLSQRSLQLLALPHDKFWRHHWIPNPLTDMVICHPNSPKNDAEKMKILDTMGVRFAPAATDRE
jgi:hypothetical protein